MNDERQLPSKVKLAGLKKRIPNVAFIKNASLPCRSQKYDGNCTEERAIYLLQR